MQLHHCQCHVKIKRYCHTGIQAITANIIVNRNFKAHRSLENLVTDITYIPFGSKMLYLSSIIDLYNGESIAYTLRDTQDVSSVVDTWNQLPDIHESCILHSNQGSVYTSKGYQLHIKNKGITMSISQKGTPTDNAPIESFHSSLKCETFYLNPELKSSTEILSQTVIEYIQ